VRKEGCKEGKGYNFVGAEKKYFVGKTPDDGATAWSSCGGENVKRKFREGGELRKEPALQSEGSYPKRGKREKGEKRSLSYSTSTERKRTRKG